MAENTTASRPKPPPVRRRTVTAASEKPRPQAAKRSRKTRRRMPIRRELSAGGVAVREEDGDYFVALLMTEHKQGKVWVLPKGHVELGSGEKVPEAARREVEEEAGISDLAVKDQLGITRFRFQAETAVVHKTVHYFLMTTNQKRLIPQAEEGMIDAAWFPIRQAVQELAYDTDQDIVAKAYQKLTGHKLVVPVRRQRRPSRRSASKGRNVGRAPRIRV